ncbi:uncharacterized protein LOC120475260 [Pimephales promelas]|uniref:uncharacterized protein LOC120475260 n=1 Tax=Pimephales promelas TaxID=90988 RepID=UPI001955CB69|nr:uncharacterized protein LOC120475260 [Pimephales promelas]
MPNQLFWFPNRYLNLLLLFCFISHCGTTPVPVTGGKGGDVTLTCESEARDISALVLSRLSKNILVCDSEECKSENSRFCKEGSCDVIIKDLIYSDAGKYLLRVYYSNDQREILQYKLHIHDEISVKKAEDLKLDVLLTNADKVERNSGSGWTELWRRGHGVSSDGLSVSEQTLIIHEFTDTDTGSYRVLDSNNEALITVTVTVVSTGSGSTGEHTASPHRDREPLSWPEKVNGIFVITIFIAYIVIMVIQIVLRFAGRFW